MEYIIQAGDTLSGIATKEGITQALIEKANPQITNPNEIKAGDKLTIPIKEERVDEATSAANNANKEEAGKVVEDCPLQGELFSIKPVRYGVVENNSLIETPEKLLLTSKLPILKSHKYIGRELVDHTVYLYNIEEKYLLEYQYKEGVASSARSVFGVAPTKIVQAFPLIMQQKGAKFVMWLTQTPLTESRINIYEKQPELFLKLGQKIDFYKMLNLTQTDCRPFFGWEKLVAEIQGKIEDLSWTHPPLKPFADKNSIKADCESQTPDNYYAVYLIDAIGITRDLCREFSIAYELFMRNLATTQHPHYMAKLTRLMINKEESDALYVKELDEASYRESLRTIRDIDFARNASNGIFEELEIPTGKAFQEGLARERLLIKKNAENAAKNRKLELENCIYADEMDDFLEKSSDESKKNEKLIEELAEDWLLWIKDEKGQLDIALSWLDDANLEQIQLKEALIASMVNNINAIDNGSALVSKWVDYLLLQLQAEEEGSKTLVVDGIAPHYLLSHGFNTKGLITGSTVLKSVLNLGEGIAEAVVKYRKGMLDAAKYTVTAASEILFETTTVHMSKSLVKSPNGRLLWGELFLTMESRWDIKLATVNTDLSQVVPDIRASYAGVMAVSGNHIIEQEVYTSRQIRMLSEKKVNLIDLESTGGKAAKYPRFLAKHMNKFEVYIAGNKGIASAFNKSEKLFAGASKSPYLGIFAAAQLYNAISIAQVMGKPMKDSEYYQMQVNFYSSLYNVAATSIALVDKYRAKAFGGTSLSVHIGGHFDEVTGKLMPGKGVAAIDGKIAKIYQNISAKGVESKIADKIFLLEKTGVVGYTFRSIPTLGAVFSTVSSSFQLYNDVHDENNAGAIALSTMSLVANAASIVCFAAAIVYSGPLLIPIGLALSLFAIGVDTWHSFIADGPIVVLLKHSFWGKGDYKYADDISGLDDKFSLFTQIDQEDKKKNIFKSARSELIAFCNHLCKPIIQVVEYKKVNGYDIFTLEIQLPYFKEGDSGVAYSLKGDVGYNGKEHLVMLSDSAIGENYPGRLFIKIDENNLTKQKLHLNQRGRLMDVTNTEEKGMDYKEYELSLTYIKPANMPITLNYPTITIDNHFSVLAWRDQIEIDEFKLEETKE